jgi:glycosyltransferase involved in cell wall biosynthesis
VIRGGDMVLMTSISEAMPMTLLEAMAQGRPSVATSVGGVPGVLRGCGIVAPPGDVHAIATAIVTLLRNPALAAQLGRRGYERLHRRYTFERRVAAYRDLINEEFEATHQRVHRPSAAPAPGQRSGAERLLPG